MKKDITTDENTYNERFDLFYFFVNYISTYGAGMGGIVLLGNPSFSFEYIFKLVGICSLTIGYIFKTLYNTPEKIKSNKDTYKRPFFLILAIIIFILTLDSLISKPYSMTTSLAVYTGLMYFIHFTPIFLNYLFSK